MILKFLLNIQMGRKIFTKILKNTICGKKSKALIVFDGMIEDIINNKKRNSVVTELFIRGRKLNI